MNLGRLACLKNLLILNRSFRFRKICFRRARPFRSAMTTMKKILKIVEPKKSPFRCQKKNQNMAVTAAAPVPVITVSWWAPLTAFTAHWRWGNNWFIHFKYGMWLLSGHSLIQVSRSGCCWYCRKRKLYFKVMTFLFWSSAFSIQCDQICWIFATLPQH